MTETQPADEQYAYLGPAGTFTEAALIAYLDSADGPGREAVTAVSHPTVPSALDAVRDGTAVAAMVPLENSVGGSVPTTIDELAVGRPLVIHREVHLPVAFALLARPGTTMAEVTTVAGHPQAHLQCRGWLREQLPQAEAVETSSNADAARLVAEGRWDAALAAGSPMSSQAALIADIRAAASGVAARSGWYLRARRR